MECNKEEAIRAKDIAVKKMQNGDFSGALKIAFKAQQLFNDLENIAQVIVVCEVHCASQKRFFGSEMDWYAILKLELTADEATIKKQYRKLALQLHPDKNQFPGAEAAFKLIGDAQRILLDQGKRSAHDMKRRATDNRPAPAAACRPPQKHSWFSQASATNSYHTNFPGMNSQPKQQQTTTQSGLHNGRTTFWTKCPYCTVKYQYYSEILHRPLRCQNCNKTFVAYDAGPVLQPTNTSQPKFTHQNVVLNQDASKVAQGSQRNFTAEKAKATFYQKQAQSSEVGTGKVSGKRGRKQTVESSESCNSTSSSDSEEEVVIDDNGNVLGGKNFDRMREQNLRRSGRRKQNVSYKENLSDEEDMVSPAKKAKNGAPDATDEGEEIVKEDKSKINTQSGEAVEVKADQNREGNAVGSRVPIGNEEILTGSEKDTAKVDDVKKTAEAEASGVKRNSGDSVADSSTKEREPETYAYPDSEFNDFDKERKEGCFSVGQIWAMYDTLDAMPRFYARIRKVFPSGFKLKITWLEPDPDDENEIKWINEGFPVSCGKFRHGASEFTEDRLMFSHLLYWEKGIRRDTYKIFPRKGETWALFKNWNIKWKLDAGTDPKFEYEFVEILAEYVEGLGIRVAYLTKVEEFVSVFCRMSKERVDSFLVPPHELFRFSHKVPSFLLAGKERKGVPKGSFELDPASLPAHPEENVVASKDPKLDGDSRHLNNSSCSSSTENVTTLQGSKERTPASTAGDGYEIPESEFYDFDADKLQEKFVVGQIWALYCDEDGLPKYYGEIKRIELKPNFKIHLRWLEPIPLPNTVVWYDSSMPTSCGRFRIKRASSQVYHDTISFSHKIKVELFGSKDFAIFPRKGEIWALYRNWTPLIKSADLKKWKYDVVQVMEETDLHFKVVILELVDGFKTLFRAKVRGRSNVMLEIPRRDQIMFSHQIPSFQLTNERNGKLRGCWELDLAALPEHQFSS